MKARVITGFILTGVIIALTLFAPSEVIAGMLSMAILLALWEFLSLPRGYMRTLDKICGVLVSLGICLTMMFAPYQHVLESVLIMNAVGTIFLLLETLFTVTPIYDSGKRASHLISGVTYVTILSCFSILILRPENGDFGRYVFLIAAGVTWGGDTLAFFGGKMLGRHKLYETVSPKKTWEGAIAGIIGSLLFATAIMVIFKPQTIEWQSVLCFALIGGPLGQTGDLVESFFKRTYDIKDSGSILPGHGGLLDRIDAFIFVAPFAYLWFIY